MSLPNQYDPVAPFAVSDTAIWAIASRLGVAFDDPRMRVLRSGGSFDVQACPGSGKTTLLVAKLALLAETWSYTRRGICVLSHTNVARAEIEEKLAGTRAGQLLLTYPHFVGTIHGFVNEFLALPMLRSTGKEVRLVDNEACGEYCRSLLYRGCAYTTARAFLSRREQYSPDRTVTSLRFEGAGLNLGCAAGTLPCGPATDTFRALVEIKKRAADAGFWRHDDMFAWAERLLSCCPEAVAFARRRFPVVFIDEMQDTSELQNRLLSQVFPADACTMRQRFGDSNQAIYDYGGERAATDPFPGDLVYSIPNSKRFGSMIAQQAAPVAPAPVEPELAGDGPNPKRFSPDLGSCPMPHTIFLFAEESIGEVLPAFGSLLLRVFPDAVLHSSRFVARAIGRVGQSQAEGDKIPRHLIDYWTGYQAKAAKLEARPAKLADYLHLAQRRRAGQCDCADAVKVAAGGLSQLARILNPSAELSPYRPMKSLRDASAPDQDAKRAIENLIWRWCLSTSPIVRRCWSRQIEEVRQVLVPVVGDAWSTDAEEFCQWSDEFAGGSLSPTATDGSPPNVFRFSDGSRSVDIDVGTIHSAKGQTHTATLVLGTHFKKHDLVDLLPWLLGDRYGAGKSEGVERLDRMRLIYTAMTRPSHLLCLAIHKEVAQAGADGHDTVGRLEARGWVVQVL